MTVKEFGECIEYNIRNNIKHAILGLGAPGVGKSQLIRQIGKKYGYKVIDIRLAQMSEVEIGGLIYPNESRTKTIWLAPEVLPNEERDGEKTILRPSENILYFPCSKRILLWSRHSSAVTADLLLPSIRKIKHLDINKTIICTLNGLADECAVLFTSAPDVFNGSRLLYQLKQKGVTIPHCKKAPLPPLRKRLSHFLLQQKAPKKCVRYAIFLSLIAFFTPFRIYYWSCAALLIIFAVSLKLKTFFQSKKIF